jgi:endonuclease YncB( thermonuclease family)
MDLAGLEGTGPGAVVESVQYPAPGGQAYRLGVPGQRQAWLYTFRAQVKEVVDGDTLWVVVDCGFDVWVEQKLRLRDLDAPELETVVGRQARAFVEEALGEVEFVVLSTHRSDKYDRYLADVFHRPGEQDPQRVLVDGLYLNRQLLDEGLARRWVE